MAKKKPLLPDPPISVKQIGDEILHITRHLIKAMTGEDEDLHFLVNRWVHARLQFDERLLKRPIKQELWDSGQTSCQICGKRFASIKGVEIHRKNAKKGYSLKNCELVCRSCHERIPLPAQGCVPAKLDE